MSDSNTISFFKKFLDGLDGWIELDAVGSL